MAHSLTTRLNCATEVEVMQLIWAHHYRTSLELTTHIQRTRAISITTVNTILMNMTKKGLLTCERAELVSRKHSYTPTCTKLEYLAQTVNAVLSAFAATPAERSWVLDALYISRVCDQACQPILGTAELAIMQLMWSQNYRAAREIIPHFRERYTHAVQTVNIILVRLARKGLLKQERPTVGKRPYSYRPTLTKTVYLRQEIARVLTTVDATSTERACLSDLLR